MQAGQRGLFGQANEVLERQRLAACVAEVERADREWASSEGRCQFAEEVTRRLRERVGVVEGGPLQEAALEVERPALRRLRLILAPRRTVPIEQRLGLLPQRLPLGGDDA